MNEAVAKVRQISKCTLSSLKQFAVGCPTWLALTAASDGGPPEISRFLFIGIAFVVFFVVLRRILHTGATTRRKGKPTQPFEVQLISPQAEAPEQLQARLKSVVTQTTSAGPLVNNTALSSPPPTPVQPAMGDRAILFRQHFPPRNDALSYWGGVPLVPQDFTWPSFTTHDGVERALHLIMQIDCAAIPDARRLGLPEHGLLYVFVDLDWGNFWECRVLYAEGDPRLFTPAAVPAILPHAYGDQGVWGWVRRDEDWPRLLPRWSFDPVLVNGTDLPPVVEEDEAEERRFWPGTIDLPKALTALDGAIAESHYHQNRYDSDNKLVRPFANFPHDWKAVRIAMGEIADQSHRGHIARFVKRGDMSQAEGDAFAISLQSSIDQWNARAQTADPIAPLATVDSDAVWQVFVDFQKVTHFALGETVNQSINATLSANPDPAHILPEEALALVRSSHAIGSRGEHGLHINTPDHFLGPPSYVQGGAEERLGKWRLLFEMSSCDPIGHFFAEGVYQFWIRPEDLAARCFNRVELEGSAY